MIYVEMLVGRIYLPYVASVQMVRNIRKHLIHFISVCSFLFLVLWLMKMLLYPRYCMREMLQKVPEGDWMCEECKFDEEMKNRKGDKSVKFDGYRKSYLTGQTAIDDTGVTIKTEAKPSDVDGETASDTKISGKRRMDDSEVSSVAKKQAFEPASGSPKTLSPNRLIALSRESSFNNSDKGKLKSINQISSGGLSVHDTPAWGSRLQTARGNFIEIGLDHTFSTY